MTFATTSLNRMSARRLDAKSKFAGSIRVEAKRNPNRAWARPILIAVSFFAFATGVVLLPGARWSANAALKPPATGLATSAGLRAATGLAKPQASQRSSTDEEDADIPPFARGFIDKESYLRQRGAFIDTLRGLPYTTPYNPRARAVEEMKRQIEQQAPLISTTMWEPVGPAPLPNGQTEVVSTAVSGRVSAVAVHPTNPNIAYVGAAQGGVYRTLDGGTTWTPIFDSAQSLAIGSIAIAPSQPTTVYVGTGEPNGSCDSFFGVGIYRITDAETSPVLAGPFNQDGSMADVFSGRAVGRIVVHPTDPNTIFASTTSGIGGIGCDPFGGGTIPPLPGRGLFRSTNALTSCTFTKMTTATGTNILVGNFSHVDVAMDPANANRVVVTVNGPMNPMGGGTGGGVYVSTDALAGTPTFARTLSLDNVRIELALHSAAGTVNVYAASGESSGRLRRSTDGGATWSPVLATANGFCGGQCFYDIAVAVDPTNANTVLLGGNVTGASSRLIARSTDGGATFLNTNAGVHVDNHAITFAPSDNQIAYMGTDGGIYRTTNNGLSWATLNNTSFNATQFQSLALHPTNFFFTIGGTQDNGTEFWEPSGMTANWRRADFGDGGFALIDQNAPDITNVTMYHTYFNQANAKGYARVLTTLSATDGGWSFFGCGFGGSIPNGMTCGATETTLFYAPMALGPGNPNMLYFGADVLYRSSDSGTNMTKVSQQPLVAGRAISAIGISPQNDDVRIVGLSCNRTTGECAGRVFRTMTGGNPLTDVSSGSFPARYVGRAVIDPNNQNTAYVTFAGFAVPAGEHVWKTTNLNAAPPVWTASGTGIPDVPVNAFAIDPLDSNKLYAGTDIGVYRSTDGGANWLPFGTGLPVVAVFDMAIQNANRVLRIATHGRGIWQISLQPTAAKVLDVSATAHDDGQVLIEWQTASEVDNLGFNVYREQDGKRVRITSHIIAGSALVSGPGAIVLTGSSYQWSDVPTRSSRELSYWLEDVDLNGESTWTGPIKVKQKGKKANLLRKSALLSSLGVHQAVLMNGNESTREQVSGSLPSPAPADIDIQRTLASGPAVKISINREGWYRVTQPELMAAGLNPTAESRTLQLFVDGREVPIIVTARGPRLEPTDAIEFYGVGLDTPSTDTRCYWLVSGRQPGQRIKRTPSIPAPGSGGSFTYTVERKDRTIYFSALRNGEAENFFGPVITAQPVDQSLNLQHLDESSESAVLEVNLQGVTRVEHLVRALVNGHEVGSISFAGQARGSARLAVKRSTLREGINVVRLVAYGGQSDVSLVDSIRIAYQHTYTADNNELWLTAGAGQQISVDGFTNSAVRVIDITDSERPQEIAGTVTSDKGGFSVTGTVPERGQRRLVAFSDAQAKRPISLAANQPSNWRGASAELIIFTTRMLLAGVEPLAALRRSEGMAVAVVDLEDVYDEFSFGHRRPQAVKDLILYGRNFWRTTPRFALFVGDATFDERNYLGFGNENLVPSKLIDTAYMETASDDWFADSNQDGLAEIAVGRIPVRTTDETNRVMAKIIGYERRLTDSVLLVSDISDAYDFSRTSSAVHKLIPPDVKVQVIDRGKLDGDVAKTRLLEAINGGLTLVNYNGHGSMDRWRGNLLTSADARTLNNRRNLPLVIAMTCLNGYFQDTMLESLAESLVKADRGGAVAVWASSGLTEPAGQNVINLEVMRLVFRERGLTLGEATLNAKAMVTDIDVRRTWILFGDPTTKLR